MFAINFNFPYRKKDGSLITMEKALDGAGADLDLIDLDDVALSNPAEGDGLVYDSTVQKWKNSHDELSAIENVYGSKNLLPYPYKTSSYSNRGVDFTSNANGSILVNGSNDNTNNSIYQLHGAWASTTLILPAGKYIISTGTDNSDIAISVCYNDTLLRKITGEEEVNAPNGISYITCEVIKGKSISNVTVYPMIRDARIKDSTFVSYAMTNRELTEAVTLHTNEPILLATAAADQTWAEQLTSLKTTYDTLTNAQKKRTFINIGTGYNEQAFANTHTGIGGFSGNICDSTGQILMYAVRMMGSLASRATVSTSGTLTFTNLSSTTNSSAITLWLN